MIKKNSGSSSLSQPRNILSCHDVAPPVGKTHLVEMHTLKGKGQLSLLDWAPKEVKCESSMTNHRTLPSSVITEASMSGSPNLAATQVHSYGNLNESKCMKQSYSLENLLEEFKKYNMPAMTRKAMVSYFLFCKGIDPDEKLSMRWCSAKTCLSGTGGR